MSASVANLKLWSQLSHLSSDFVMNLKQVFIFGARGDEILMVDQSDKVFGLGSNQLVSPTFILQY